MTTATSPPAADAGTVPPEPEAPPDTAPDTAPTEQVSTAMREALLAAIGELSDEERERLVGAEAPDETARVWRDLVAERAARERETSVRAELTRELQTQVHAARPRPTSGLQGSAVAAPPASVAEWTDYIRQSDDSALRQRRRSQFADWLAANPDA